MCWCVGVWVCLWRWLWAQFFLKMHMYFYLSSSCLPPRSICCMSVAVFVYAVKWAKTSWSFPTLRANVQSESKPASPSVISCPARTPWTRARGLLRITYSKILFSLFSLRKELRYMYFIERVRRQREKDPPHRDTQRGIFFVLFHWMKYRQFDITLRYSCPALLEFASRK